MSGDNAVVLQLDNGREGTSGIQAPSLLYRTELIVLFYLGVLPHYIDVLLPYNLTMGPPDGGRKQPCCLPGNGR